MSERTVFSVALAGNPNAGKSSLFNALTGSSQKVGNFAGVTVEKKTGFLKGVDQTVELVDLPGIYDVCAVVGESSECLSALDETIAQHHLLGIGNRPPDCILNVLDASHLERNLYLTTELKQFNLPMILVLNMNDVAQKKGIYVNAERLSQALGCPLVVTNLRKGEGVDAVKTALLKQLSEPKRTASSVPRERIEPQVRYAQVKEWMSTCYALGPMKSLLTPLIDKLALNRYLGLPIFFLMVYLMFEVSITVGGIFQPLFDEGSRLIFVDGLGHLLTVIHAPLWLNAVLTEGVGVGLNTVLTFIPQVGLLFLCLSFLEDSGYMARAAFVMDRLMRMVGLPGKSFVPLIIGFGCNVPAIMAARTLDFRDRLLTIIMSPFMSCGARLAIFAVFSSAFFPHSGAWIVFLLYSLGVVLAFMTAFIVQKTILKSRSAPFMIELPIYHWPKWRLLSQSTFSRLKSFLFRAGFVILPVCVLLGTLNTLKISWESKQPVKVEWIVGGSSDSVLAKVSQKITPFFHPMGIETENWPATVGLLTGALAKEVVIGTLNTLYTQNEVRVSLLSNQEKTFDWKAKSKAVFQDVWDSLSHMPWQGVENPFVANESEHEMSVSAMGAMEKRFGSPFVAFVFMLFVLLYVPCVSTIAVTAKEAGARWAWLSTGWSLIVAYTFSVVVYQFGLFLEGAFHQVWLWEPWVWIFSMLLLLALSIGLMKRFGAFWLPELTASKAASYCMGCRCG